MTLRAKGSLSEVGGLTEDSSRVRVFVKLQDLELSLTKKEAIFQFQTPQWSSYIPRSYGAAGSY